jgi:type I thyroxine 5'-deiodinase
MYEKYGNEVAFYAVYILEAHPSDIWQMQSNVKDNVVFVTPKDYEERNSIANSCVRKLGIKFPAVIDDIENVTEKAYTGWPDRLYLIDRDGRVVYKSRPGPFGFRPDELNHSLETLKLRASR